MMLYLLIVAIFQISIIIIFTWFATWFAPLLVGLQILQC